MSKEGSPGGLVLCLVVLRRGVQVPHGEVAVGVGRGELVPVVREPDAGDLGERARSARRPHARRVTELPQLDRAVRPAGQIQWLSWMRCHSFDVIDFMFQHLNRRDTFRKLTKLLYTTIFKDLSGIKLLDLYFEIK